MELIYPGSINKLSEVLSALEPKSVFLVHGQSFSRSGAAEAVSKALSSVRHQSYLCPSASYLELELVQEVVGLARRFEATLLLAVGGGRIIDLAKLTAFGRPDSNDIKRSLQGEIGPEPPLPILAIPTTAGSGSHATHFAVVFQSQRKHSLAHPDLLPIASIVDANLLRSCPQRLRATSGLDALSQAVESFWSVRSTTESREMAAEAIKLCRRSLSRAVHSDDAQALGEMAYAAHLAGKAINISFTTAAHACSYLLTSHYGLSHGHAVALLLARLCLLNFESAKADEGVGDPRGADFVRQRFDELLTLFGVNQVQALCDGIVDTIAELGLETTLEGQKIDPNLLLEQAKVFVNIQRLDNNPCRLKWTDIQRLYQGCYS